MLTDKEIAVLQEWAVVAGLAAEAYLEAQVEPDKTSTDYLIWSFAKELATALLARQRLERRLGKLAPYAVHQATCTTVLSMTDHCSCGLHAALRNEEAQDAED